MATTTLQSRREIQRGDLSAAALALRFGVSATTVRRRRGWDSIMERSHARRHLGVSLSAVEEEAAVELRRRLVGFGRDDAAEIESELVARRDLPLFAAANGLPKRAARRWGVFAAEAPGTVHPDVKHLPKLKGRRAYIYAAIERAARYCAIAMRVD